MPGLKTDAFFIDPEWDDNLTDAEFRAVVKEHLSDLAARANKLKTDYEKVDLEATVTRIVRGGGGSSGGGGSVAVIPFRTSVAVPAGASGSIPIPSSMRTGTTDYIVNAVLFVSGFGAQILGQPETKNVNSFEYADIPAAGTLYFDIGQQP